MFTLGIDLGGTNIAVGVVNEKYEIVGRGKVKTNADRPAEEIIADMAKACFLALENAGLTLDDVDFIGIGAPGSIDPVNGYVLYTNNIPFVNMPLVDTLKSYLGKDIKCYIENDANAAAFGEYLAGAGKGTNDFVIVTLGTGVGCGVVIGGKLFTGTNYAGTEAGHTVIIYNGEDCTCGRKGCWEAYASATALINQTKKAMLENKDSKMWDMVSGDIEKVNGLTAFDGMRNGDATAKTVVDNYINYVACGVTNLVNVFQPDVLSIGGGVSHEGDNILVPIREFVVRERYSKNVEKQTEINAAKLGNDAGIIGAACLYKNY
ncbi:MAG: ROK family protein [Clostridia bacterium]|nr:ROK family protein [Clostridia bacterium]